MASAHLSVDHKIDWPLANPWLWLSAGLALCTWSWLWTLTFGASSSELRIVVLALGLLVLGAGIWLRFFDRQTVYLAPQHPALATVLRLAVGALFTLIALGVTGLLAASFFAGRDIGWRIPPTFLVWLTAAPLAFYSARRCLVRDAGQLNLDAAEEIALALVVGAAGAFAGSWTLYLGPAWADDWDTMRLFLRVLTAVGLGGAALVLASTRLRHLAVSCIFVLHFVGITTACLSAPPAPWLVQQTWVRIFRPYLEFMYLNNAYHFYAPEPGPQSYMWFRLIYTDENDKEQGWWYRVPEIDDKGEHHHAVSLEYQRHLALCESTAAYETQPPYAYTNAFGNPDIHPLFKNRLNLQPDAHGPVIGGQNTEHPRIPVHPTIPQLQQVVIPNEMSRRLLSSYARFVARKFARHPEHENWTFKSVKVYRVIHFIPPVNWFALHLSPADPELYRPYYVGNYNAQGEVLDAEWGPKRDPYLYWLVPILRDNPNDPNSEIKDWCRKHAGDTAWVRPKGQQKWVDPRE